MGLNLKLKLYIEKISTAKVVFITAIVFFLGLLTSSGRGVTSLGPSEKFNEELSYRTSLGKCPFHAAGNMALAIVKIFDETRSLHSVKNKILSENWADKYFVDSYSIKFDPFSQTLELYFNCAEPLMRVQFYKNNGSESYESILVDSGKLVDPTYEVLLRNEKKLTHELPYLAIPVIELESQFLSQITNIVKDLPIDFRKKLSELILSETKELTMILSIDNGPTSVFLGADKWNEKVLKLKRIISYFEKNDRTPATINLTNQKKVVVKFR